MRETVSSAHFPLDVNSLIPARDWLLPISGFFCRQILEKKVIRAAELLNSHQELLSSYYFILKMKFAMHVAQCPWASSNWYQFPIWPLLTIDTLLLCPVRSQWDILLITYFGFYAFFLLFAPYVPHSQLVPWMYGRSCVLEREWSQSWKSDCSSFNLHMNWNRIHSWLCKDTGFKMVWGTKAIR